MRTSITKAIAAALLSTVALGAAAGSASALPAIQAARESAGRLSAGSQQVECWDWTNEDGTTGSECRPI